MVVYLIRSVFGPELYKIYKHGQVMSKDYAPKDLEFYSNYMISIFRGFYVFCKWTSPVILAYVYSRDYFTLEGLNSILNLASVLGVIIGSCYMARAFGRWSNPDYQQFLKRFIEYNKLDRSSAERKKFLSEYDFELHKWNADFLSPSYPPKFQNVPHRLFHNSILDTLKFNVWRVLSKICVHTFGIRMMYPGVFLQSMVGKVLLDGRSKLIEQNKGQRAVIRTLDSKKNKIDTMFIDRRSTVSYSASNPKFATLDSNSGKSSSNGKYLVIGCDGNASFYEIGLLQGPIENGYSVLGWNYPGFGHSTGQPYPNELLSAADAVMQYAFSLGFKEDEIVLASWSIGGFTISWLTNHYPKVRAAILDACFDDIVHLAVQQMPKFASTFVEYAIRYNLNLNVSELISRYNGPVLFIRRTQDEIISTVPKTPSTNRGNDLLISTLQNRYPYIVDQDTAPYIRTWLSAKSDIDRARILSSYTSDISTCESILATYVLKHQGGKVSYPGELGKQENSNTYNNNMELSLAKDAKLTLALYLADKYLSNFESSHCIPLPGDRKSVV